MKNEGAKNYAAKASSIYLCGQSCMKKSPQSAIFNISILGEDKRIAN